MVQKVVLMIGIILALTTTVVDAQNDEYRLREPSAEEYLQIISGHFADNPAAVAGQDIRSETVSALSAGALHLFESDASASFTDLYEAYQRLNIGYLDGVYRGEWNSLLVRRWLYENQPDLSTIEELELAPEFLIGVTPRDFNADGQDEYVLDVWNVDTIHMYLVAVAEENSYRVIDPGLPWTGYTPFGRMSAGEGQITDYGFRDLNADGLPEWLVLLYDVTAGGPGIGYTDSGFLYILSWHEGSLINLGITRRDAPDGLLWNQLLTFSDVETIGDTLPATVTFDFLNLDGDDALEITISRPITNNWGCRRTETRRFDWDASEDLYLYHDTEIVFDDSQNCLQQAAEEAMWEGDYNTAVDQFEQALTLPPLSVEEDYLRERAQTRTQYLRARLAMAYRFIDQPDRTAPLLDELAAEDIADEAVAAYVEALRQSEERVVWCAGAYTAFATHFPSIAIGGTTDNPYYDGPFYDPAQVGCDAPAEIARWLEDADIRSDTSPVSWLAENGLPSDRTFAIDLNEDGQDEILVWLEVPGVQILFVSHGDSYAASLTSVDPYQYADELDTWRLPGEAGLGIARWNDNEFHGYDYFLPWPTSYGTEGFGGNPSTVCGIDENTTWTGVIRLWRLDETSLTEVLRMSTCEDTIQAALGSGGQRSITTNFQAYRWIPDEGEVLESTTLTYTWDEVEGRYVWEPPATPTPQAITAPTATPTPETPPQRTYYSATRAFADEAYNIVLDMTPSTLDLSTSEDRDVTLAEMYLRGLSLKALGKDDMALALFVEVQTAASEHIIGKLAALHLEQVPTE